MRIISLNHLSIELCVYKYRSFSDTCTYYLYTSQLGDVRGCYFICFRRGYSSEKRRQESRWGYIFYVRMLGDWFIYLFIRSFSLWNSRSSHAMKSWRNAERRRTDSQGSSSIHTYLFMYSDESSRRWRERKIMLTQKGMGGGETRAREGLLPSCSSLSVLFSLLRSLFFFPFFFLLVPPFGFLSLTMVRMSSE